MLWLIPALCAGAAIVCSIVGVVAVVGANRQLQAGIDRAKTARVEFDSVRLSRALERLGRDVDGAKVLSERVGAALQEIRTGLSDLRLREAVAALRVARLAIRALAILR